MDKNKSRLKEKIQLLRRAYGYDRFYKKVNEKFGRSRSERDAINAMKDLKMCAHFIHELAYISLAWDNFHEVMGKLSDRKLKNTIAENFEYLDRVSQSRRYFLKKLLKMKLDEFNSI